MRAPGLLRGASLAAGLVGAAGAAAIGLLLRKAVPPWDGVLHASGLHATVEVQRDQWGIPHIFALNEHDAFFAQGFCTAQDRLWQMDLNRRAASGQLSELFGRTMLDADRLMRRLGFQRAGAAEWERVSATVREAFTAYAEGVNAWREQAGRGGRLPIEYVILRAVPAPWTPVDSLSFGRFFAFTQATNWTSELTRSRLISALGYVGAAATEPDVWQADSDDIPRLDDWGPGAVAVPERTGPALPEGPVGSNAWAVDGAHSTTGRPLLANDPHLFPSVPSAFYEAHVVGGALNVIGASLPGIPGIGIGHNRHVAWGFTASMADVQDFYVERVDAAESTRTWFDSARERGTVVAETIAIRGHQPWVEEVLITARHGPLITPTPALPSETRYLALRSTVLEARDVAGPLLGLNQVDSAESLRLGVQAWETPPFNVVYADTEGRTGFQMIGRVPLRARGLGLVPAPGWSGEFEWLGHVPAADMPGAHNPADGLTVTANNNVDPEALHFFSREFVHSARADRIRQVLSSRARLSALDFAQLQADDLSLPGREIVRLLAAGLQSWSRDERQALQALAEWDGRVSSDSVAASVYQVWRDELPSALHPSASSDLLGAIKGQGPHPLLAPVASAYFMATGRALQAVREWSTLPKTERQSSPVQCAFNRAVSRLVRGYGHRPASWQWGRIHSLRLAHPLSVRKPLGRLFDVPAFAWQGDLETVSAGGPRPGTLEAGGPTSGYRFIADCCDWDASLSCIPGGQSGHRGSAHYADQVDAWRRVAYHPLAFTRPAVDRLTRHRLTLQTA